MFRLALALGRTVAELKQTLGSAELGKWQTFYRIEPFGPWRDNYHAALIAQAIYNASGKMKKQVKYEEFMIEPRSVKEQRKQRETMNLLSALAAQNGKE